MLAFVGDLTDKLKDIGLGVHTAARGMLALWIFIPMFVVIACAVREPGTYSVEHSHCCSSIA
jgi:hypothetical protein